MPESHIDKKQDLSARTRRAQFVLGPAFVQQQGWNQIDLGSRGCLTAHPDLEVTSVQSGDTELTLLGFILDWRNPDHSNGQILDGLLASASDASSCIRLTDELCGRWLLIVRCGDEHVLFHDPGGLRQVCFTKPAAGTIPWCASQPDLLAEVADLERDIPAGDFIDAMAAINPEYWWPGDRTAYCGGRVLLPNHLLDLARGEMRRFFPDGPRQNPDYGDVVSRGCGRLRGTLAAAARRFDLVLGLSAGLDSRLLLAASREIPASIEAYNVQPEGVPDSQPDVSVPRKLCEMLSVPLVPLKQAATASTEFLTCYCAHSWRPRKRFAAGVEAQLDAFRGAKVAIIGNFAEVAKLPYRKSRSDDGEASVDGLAAAVKMNGQPFAEQAIAEWKAGIADNCDYRLADLFYWEQRVGRWLATNQVEFDFGWQDILVPLNNRAFIRDLLAVDEIHRDPEDHKLFLAMIKTMWPETMTLPINPKEKPGLWRRVKKNARKIIGR